MFRRLCDGVERGQFKQLADRDDLWRLLVAITTNRAIDQQRFYAQQKRGGGQVRGESRFERDGDSLGRRGLDQLVGTEPTPEILNQIAEEHDRLMDRLDERLRQIAIWKLESRDNEEIGKLMGITSRSVRRKLERIREIWQEDVPDE